MIFCKIEACENQAIVKGLCQKHYKRLIRNGDPEKLSSRLHGKSGEAIYDLWQNIKRNNVITIEWREFKVFFKDVGDKPTSCHMLKRKDINKPLGKDNFYWHITEKNKEYLQNRK